MATMKDLYNLTYSDKMYVEGVDELQYDLVLDESENTSSSITGTVTDEDENPVVGATVKLFDAEGQPYRHTMTDENGKYSFDDLMAKAYSVTAVCYGSKITIPKSVILNEDEIRKIDIVVEQESSIKLGTLAGIITEEIEGEIVRVAQAKIFLKDPETEEVVATTTSANDGEYVFYDIENGNYTVIASKDGYKVSGELSISVTTGSIINSNIRIEKDPVKNTGTISGYCKSKGNSVVNAYVGLYEILENGTEILVSTTRTNNIGYYMFGDVEGGNYVVKSKMNKSMRNN